MDSPRPHQRPQTSMTATPAMHATSSTCARCVRRMVPATVSTLVRVAVMTVTRTKVWALGRRDLLSSVPKCTACRSRRVSTPPPSNNLIKYSRKQTLYSGSMTTSRPATLVAWTMTYSSSTTSHSSWLTWHAPPAECMQLQCLFCRWRDRLPIKSPSCTYMYIYYFSNSRLHGTFIWV
jgi:hypothetical protein